MIYVSADDYGLCDVASEHIIECVSCGALNKVSIFPNFDEIDFGKFRKGTLISLHLNLVEGKCMANPRDIPLLADEDGNLKHSFTGLLKLSLLRPKEFSAQVVKEIRAQILFWKSILPKDSDFCIDGHQHTHMIPSVFDMLLKVLEEENLRPRYVRIPREPLAPYIKTPSLYFTYSMVNIIKQWLLNFLWCFNKREGRKLHTALFMGILFSGKMDEKRVAKILPKYEKLAIKKKMDVEILFHPGYLDSSYNLKSKNIAFRNFYLSQNRKTEHDTVIKLHKK